MKLFECIVDDGKDVLAPQAGAFLFLHKNE